MIAEYESEERDFLLGAPRQYGLTQQHKHLKEMRAVCGLEKAPAFSPIVADFYSGMEVTVPVFAEILSGGATIDTIKNIYAEKYNGEIVRYTDELTKDGFVSGLCMHGKDGMKISVAGNEERILLMACYDNLGKGASGAAIECMNLAIGAEKTKGLVL